MSQKSANLGLTRQTASGSEISNFEKSESANSEFRFGISVKFWRRRVLREFIWRALIQMFRGLTGDLGHYRPGSARIAPPRPPGIPFGGVTQPRAGCIYRFRGLKKPYMLLKGG